MRRFAFFALIVAVVVGPFAMAQEREGAPRRRAPRVFAGCPEAPAQFDPCATEKAKAFTPPRTPEGDPDLRGYWGRTMNSYDLEAHPLSLIHISEPTRLL